MTYARDTSVPAERSRNEIERTLARYGADHFMYGTTDAAAVVAFRMGERHAFRQVKFTLPLPTLDDPEVVGQRRRTATQREAARDQLVRARWRALLLVIKAKLEAVESGIVTFDQEFLSHILLPDGETVSEWIQSDLDRAYDSKQMPSSLMLALPAAGGTHGD